MRVIVPPIKSQGIKTKLVPWIQSLLPATQGRWVEPFLGTGVVAFNAGFKQAILNDINPHLIHFYQAIQEKQITPALVQKYLETEGQILKTAGDDGYDQYRAIRERFNREHNPLDFLFLSRAGFNGMIRFNRKGEWNIPFCQKSERFTKAYITKIVNQVRDVSRIIQPEWVFLHQSFQEVILLAEPDDIIYCDPPYLGRYVDYYNGWSEKDEHQLFELLSKTKARFILSTWHHNEFRDNEMIKKYWGQFEVITRDHFYHSGGKLENRKAIVEALVFNFSAQLQPHNHGVLPKTEQLSLWSELQEVGSTGEVGSEMN